MKRIMDRGSRTKANTKASILYPLSFIASKGVVAWA